MPNTLLAIDPGFSLGHSVWQKQPNSAYKLVEQGQLFASPRYSEFDRLDDVDRRLAQLISDWRPDAIAIENVIIGNYKSATAKMSCLGTYIVAFMAAGNHGIPLHPVAVQSIKARFGVKGGKDKATGKKIDAKKLMVAAVNKEFGLNLKAKEDDAADAVAVGATYISSLTKEGASNA